MCSSVNLGGRSWCRLAAGIGLAVVLALTSAASASVESLSFTQLSYVLDDTPAWADTEYGCVKFEYTGQDLIWYLNLNVNGSWQVQNLPITSPEGVGVTQMLGVDFDLGVDRYTPVTTLDYAYTFTSAVATTMPAGATSAAVAPETIAQSGGMDDGVMFDDLPPARPHVGGEAIDPVRHVVTGMPNQQCGRRECVPAAVSNSLHFLREVKGLELTDEQISIYAMKAATGWNPLTGCRAYETETHFGTVYAWWQTKKTWMEGNGYPITTRMMTDMNDLKAEIDDEQDIELIYSWKNSDDKKCSHAVNVKSITPLEDGKYSLVISSDWDQPNSSEGCYDIAATYDSESGMLDLDFDTGRHGIRKFEYAVVECPEPATLALLAIGGLALLLRRRK